jgi:hypothetical protein
LTSSWDERWDEISMLWPDPNVKTRYRRALVKEIQCAFGERAAL